MTMPGAALQSGDIRGAGFGRIRIISTFAPPNLSDGVMAAQEILVLLV